MAWMSKNIFSIQLLRAVAAISVCTVHFNAFFFILKNQNNHPLILHPLTSGVDLFFVISGFIMVYASQDLFGLSHARYFFLVKRLIRIVPLYWVTTLIYMCLRPNHINGARLIKSLFFIPYGNYATPIYSIGWTLNFEMFFYAIFTIAIIFKREWCVTIVAIFLCLLVGLQSIIVLPTPFRYWGDPMVLEFVYGMLIALLYCYNIRLPIRTSILLMILASILIWSFDGHMPPTHYRCLAWGIPAAMIMGAAVLVRPWPLLSCGHRLAILGDSSYSLYLVHTLTITIYLFFQTKYVASIFFIGIGEVVTIMLSILVHIYFEKPVTRFFMRYFNVVGKLPENNGAKTYPVISSSY